MQAYYGTPQTGLSTPRNGDEAVSVQNVVTTLEREVALARYQSTTSSICQTKAVSLTTIPGEMTSGIRGLIILSGQVVL